MARDTINNILLTLMSATKFCIHVTYEEDNLVMKHRLDDVFQIHFTGSGFIT